MIDPNVENEILSRVGSEPVRISTVVRELEREHPYAQVRESFWRLMGTGRLAFHTDGRVVRSTLNP